LLTSDRFDAVVVDLNLPDENGIELIRQMTHRQKELRILATTGVESDLYLEIAGYVGAHRTIRKRPTSPDSTFPADEWKRAVASVLASPA
jgi:DNA-binding NarL/FixJ family response regulator